MRHRKSFNIIIHTSFFSLKEDITQEDEKIGSEICALTFSIILFLMCWYYSFVSFSYISYTFIFNLVLIT